MLSPRSILYLLLFVAINLMVWWGVRSYQELQTEAKTDLLSTGNQAIARDVIHTVDARMALYEDTNPGSHNQAIAAAFQSHINTHELADGTHFWIFYNKRLHSGNQPPFTTSNRGKSITQLASTLSTANASHLDELIEGITLGSESHSWYQPGLGQERIYTAWSSTKIGQDIWTFGLSTPASTALPSNGKPPWKKPAWQLGITITVSSLIFLFLALGAQRRQKRQLNRLHEEIADRTTVENDLRENENRYRKLFTDSRAIQLIIDAVSGQIVDANDVACEYYGYHREDLKLMKVAAINAMPKAEIDAEQANARSEGRAYCLFKHQLATGQVRDVEVYSTPVRLKGRSLLYAIIHDVTQRKMMEEQIKHLGSHDVLTDLPNRALLIDRLEVAIEQSKRYSQHIAVLFIDLDGFKAINDELGHKTGDKLLQQIGIKLTLSIRRADTVARYGGDEFVILLTEAGSRKDIARVANKISAAVRKPFDIDGVQLMVGCSIGIAIYPQHGDTPELLIHQADQAMYSAKKTGGGGITFTHEESLEKI